jgi:deoxyribodipyrimidine photo-lyase
MQQSQRAHWNHALEAAIRLANQRELPVLAAFGLMDGYPEANLRHYTFLVEGLADVQRALEKRGILFVAQHGAPAEIALALGKRAAAIVTDRGYLRHQKAWRRHVAKHAHCQVLEVESDVVVPVDAVSNKAETAARTLRPKLWRVADRYLTPIRETRPHHSSLKLRVSGLNLEDVSKVCSRLRLNRSVSTVSEFFQGGNSAAQKRFRQFCEHQIFAYAEHRNLPETNEVSHMGMYLHFGHISPLWLVLEARKIEKPGERNLASFIEELVVRRELAMNFVEFTDRYDEYCATPGWARDTLARHARDEREYVYAREQLANAETHDPYWNAAMLEMTHSGYMHNYMRMYWGKQILAWSASPEEAYETALALNNCYFLDGRDANSYANVGWLFGLHDRPWPERHVFGTVRSMTASGLERKCNIDSYCEKVLQLISAANEKPREIRGRKPRNAHQEWLPFE